jgi:hypothetical protein
MPVRRQKKSIFNLGHYRLVFKFAHGSADWLRTGVIDGNKAIWTYQTPPLDKAGRTGAKVTLPKQESDEKQLR